MELTNIKHAIQRALFCSVLLCFSIYFGLAQQTLPISHDSTALKREIVVQSGAQIHSNHLSSAVSNKILFGGFIDDSEIDKSFNNLSKNGMNRTGALVNLDFIYSDYERNFFGKKQLGYVITGGHQSYFASTYKSDLFRLLARGNAQSPEITDLTDTRFYQMSHHKLGFGVLDKKTRSYFALNFVGASGFQNFDLMNGIFKQNQEKDTTDIILIGAYSGNTSAQFLRGIGMALDVDLRMPLKIKDKEHIIQILAQNVGFVRMNKNTFNYNLDTSYRYTGFTFNQIQNIADNPEFSLQDSLGISPNRRGENQWLPGFIQVAKIVNQNSAQKYQAFFGLNIYTQIIYLPQAFAGVHMKVNERFSAGLHGHLGGFGLARLGAYAQMKLGQFNLGLSSQDILGTAANIGFGHSLLFRLSWQQK